MGRGGFQVEESAVKAVVALTLKVSENTFRGMFLQTVQWGVAKGDADTRGGRARLHTLFKLARELAGTLRVVMVPYFQVLWFGVTPCAIHFSNRRSFLLRIRARNVPWDLMRNW